MFFQAHGYQYRSPIRRESSSALSKGQSGQRGTAELEGFEEISLAPGESQTVSFSLDDEELGFFEVEGNFKVEPSTLVVMIGTSSKEGLSGNFELD
ncbi:MAG: fibronectin type III-like domain-contianing protein [Cyclobacteriaceae bacterium]|nr:fibronectin type III-like domain-contianing protein [Cyclobacteriaceae bacterium]